MRLLRSTYILYLFTSSIVTDMIKATHDQWQTSIGSVTTRRNKLGSSNKVFTMNPLSYEVLELVPRNGDSFAFNLDEILK